MYKSYVRSIVDYGSYIYFPIRKALQDKLEQIQFQAIRSALGFRLSTPRNILLAEAKLSPLSLRLTQLCQNFLAKIFSNHSSQTFSTVQKFYHVFKKWDSTSRILIKTVSYCFENLSEISSHVTYNIYSHDYDTLVSSIPVNIDLGKQLKRSKHANTEIKELVARSDAVAVYTDGSKTPSGVGSACFFPQLDHKIKRKLNPNASVYTAECVALCDALDLAITNSNRNTYIFTDSLSVLLSLRAFSSSIKTNPYILELKEKYQKILRIKDSATLLTLCWIPSHIGIEGNETADNLAKQATIKECTLRKVMT